MLVLLYTLLLLGASEIQSDSVMGDFDVCIYIDWGDIISVEMNCCSTAASSGSMCVERVTRKKMRQR